MYFCDARVVRFMRGCIAITGDGHILKKSISAQIHLLFVVLINISCRFLGCVAISTDVAFRADSCVNTGISWRLLGLDFDFWGRAHDTKVDFGSISYFVYVVMPGEHIFQGREVLTIGQDFKGINELRWAHLTKVDFGAHPSFIIRADQNAFV